MTEVLIAQAGVQRERGRELPAVLCKERPAEQVWAVNRAPELFCDVALVAGEVVNEVRKRFNAGTRVIGND